MTTNNLGPLPSKCSVAIVGGGTSGLAIATELKRLGVDDVIILERENVAGRCATPLRALPVRSDGI